MLSIAQPCWGGDVHVYVYMHAYAYAYAYVVCVGYVKCVYGMCMCMCRYDRCPYMHFVMLPLWCSRAGGIWCGVEVHGQAYAQTEWHHLFTHARRQLHMCYILGTLREELYKRLSSRCMYSLRLS